VPPSAARPGRRDRTALPGLHSGGPVCQRCAVDRQRCLAQGSGRVRGQYEPRPALGQRLREKQKLDPSISPLTAQTPPPRLTLSGDIQAAPASSPGTSPGRIARNRKPGGKLMARSSLAVIEPPSQTGIGVPEPPGSGAASATSSARSHADASGSRSAPQLPISVPILPVSRPDGPSRSSARFSGRWSSCAVSRKNKTARSRARRYPVGSAHASGTSCTPRPLPWCRRPSPPVQGGHGGAGTPAGPPA